MVLKLIDKEHLIDNVWAFHFQPTEPLVWTAGQFVRVELPHDNPDEQGTKRWFTNSAAPHEGIMQITTRVTDSTFKQALAKLVEGDELQLIENPEGDFVWQDSKLPIIFVAGGIGVTPFFIAFLSSVSTINCRSMSRLFMAHAPRTFRSKTSLHNGRQTMRILVLDMLLAKHSPQKNWLPWSRVSTNHSCIFPAPSQW